AGRDMARFCKEADLPPLPRDAVDSAREQIDRLLNGKGDESVATIRDEMQRVMMEHVGVFREERGLKIAVDKVRELRERYTRVRVQDRGRIFNTELTEAWELGAMLDLAEIIAVCALNRT